MAQFFSIAVRKHVLIRVLQDNKSEFTARFYRFISVLNAVSNRRCQLVGRFYCHNLVFHRFVITDNEFFMPSRNLGSSAFASLDTFDIARSDFFSTVVVILPINPVTQLELQLSTRQQSLPGKMSHLSYDIKIIPSGPSKLIPPPISCFLRINERTMICSLASSPNSSN